MTERHWTDPHGRLTMDEANRLQHVSRFGSDGYPITKRGREWWVETFPIPFETKRAATERWEQHLDILRDKLAGRL